MSDNILVRDIHVGDSLRKWLKTHNFTRQQFAEIMGLYRSNTDRILRNPTIETDKLLHISLTLNYNFFQAFWGAEIVDESGETLKPVHIGERIELKLKEQDITQYQLAEELGIQQPVVSKLIKKESIDSGRLTAISNVLGYNFFLDFYGDYKNAYQRQVHISSHTLEEYNKLLFENEHLKTKILDLEQMVGRLQKELASLKGEREGND